MSTSTISPEVLVAFAEKCRNLSFFTGHGITDLSYSVCSVSSVVIHMHPCEAVMRAADEYIPIVAEVAKTFG